MIGDKQSDIIAGQNCGAATYLFVDPKFGNSQMGNINADYIISDLREVLKELDISVTPRLA